MKQTRTLAAVVSLLAASACGSLAASSNSISESVNNALESVSRSSTSSSPGEAESSAQNYRRDVGVFAVAWLQREEAPPGDLLRGVSRIAEEYGVTDWESAPATQLAMRDATQDEQVDDVGRARLREELAPLGAAFASALETP